MLLLAVEKVVVRVPAESSGVPTEAWLVAAGAVAAALITVVAAQRRQQTALAAERNRLKDSLDAEKRRLEQQLAAEMERFQADLRNDWNIRELKELRDRIDGVMDAGEKMVFTVFVSKGKLTGGDREGAGAEREKAVTEFGLITSRIRHVMMRLGREDSFVQLLGRYKDGLSDLDRVVGEALDSGGDEVGPSMDDWEAALASTGDAQAAVIDAANERFGSRFEDRLVDG